MTCRHAVSAAGIWATLLATSVAQLELKREPLPPAKPVEPRVQQRVIIDGGGAVLNGGVIINGGVININGANVVMGPNGLVAFDGSAVPKPEPDPAGPQILEYIDGQRLHGTLAEFDPAGGRLLWKRPDTPAPLSIVLEQVKRWGREDEAAPANPAKATVKFTGGDWLVGNVTAIQGDEVHLQLPDESRIKTTRDHIEWIHFSKTGAVETYDGPTSLAGWTSAGSWTYRDGALRASSPTPVSRNFQTLPDQVEYRMVVDQGTALSAFTISLHSRMPQFRGLTRSMTQVMLRANTLNVWGAIDGNFKSVQVDLSKILGEAANRVKGPVLFRIFEDYTGGKLIVYINQHKAGEWAIDKGEAGKNGGAFQFQPASWSGENEQSLSNIRIVPWDGRAPGEDEKRTQDMVSVSGEAKHGKVTDWDGKMLQLTTENGVVTVPEEKIGLLRFQQPANVPSGKAPAVAYVRLASRGEFDAVKLDWRDGKFQIGTHFGGVLSLQPSALAELEFNRAAPNRPLTADHLLVFRNGDRLRGTLEGAGDDGQVRWRTAPAGPPAEFAPTHVAGIQLSPEGAGGAGDMAARFRNGDWLGGKFVTLDGQHVVLDTAPLGQMTAPRALVKALYFGGTRAPAVSDGVSDHETWEEGLNVSGGTTISRKKPADGGSPWSYFAGTYSRGRAAGSNLAFNRPGGLQLGRVFDNMAQRVEVSFAISTEQNPLFFSAQIFTELNNAGYMMHLSANVLSVYDMNPRARMQGRGFASQQFPFPKDLSPMAKERRIRLFADRPTGRVTFMVDDVVVGQISPKAADGQRNLGRGVMISPQPNMACKIWDLWVGPWNGTLPGKGAENSPETVALANGDEVQGKVEGATPAALKVASDVGALELPTERLTMIDLGGPPVERRNATRVHLAGRGTLTVTAWKIEDGLLTGRSEVLGEMKVPLKAVQELVFATPPAPAAAVPPALPLPPPGGAAVPAK